MKPVQIATFNTLEAVLLNMLSQKTAVSLDGLKEYGCKIREGFNESSVIEKLMISLLIIMPLGLITLTVESAVSGYISPLHLLFIAPIGTYLVVLTANTFLYPDYDESNSYDIQTPDKFDLSREESEGLIVRDEKLKDIREKYPAVKDYVLCKIEEIYTYQNNKEKLHIIVDMPFGGSNEWTFDYPYNWSNCEFKDFAENLGYNKDNFYDMTGEYVFIKDKNETLSIIMNDPKDIINNKIEDNEWSKNDINVDQFEQALDTEIENLASKDEIIVEDAGVDLVDDVR